MKKNNLINNIRPSENNIKPEFERNLIKFLIFFTLVTFFSIFLLSKKVKSENLFFSNTISEQLELAKKFEEHKNYHAAEEVYLNAYSNGYNEAAYYLGWLYNTKGDLYDIEKSYKWWEVSARDGDYRAIYNIALAIAEGVHYDKDLDKAIKLFIKCTQVFNDAFIVIGDIYRFEKKNYQKASYFYQKALYTKEEEVIKDGHKSLARLYFSDEYLDFSKGFKHAENSANLGDLHSLYAVGMAYTTGVTDKKNNNSTIVEKDVLKGMYYLEEAAEQGHEDSMIHLAQIGLEFAKTDIEKAKIAKYVLKAVEGNNLEGIKLAAGIYADGFGVKKDEFKAFSYLVDAASKEDAYSQYYLGKLYLIGGPAVKPDLVRAEYWLNKAVANGSDQAKEELAKIKLNSKTKDTEFFIN